MKPTMKNLPIVEAAKIGKKDSFFQNVKKEVIPKLIKRGKLKGKAGVVVDDAEFRDLMQFGIESFVYNQQGWSFTAIEAPIEKVAHALRSRNGVLNYTENVKSEKMKENSDVGIQPESDKRHIFAIKTCAGNWTVIIQTVHWIDQSAIVIGLMLAAELSKSLKTTAVAAWDDDFSGSKAVICQNGKKVSVLTDEEDWADFYLYFYEQGILVPETFISTCESGAAILLAEPDLVERADYMVISIPTESQSSSPNVFFKIGMLAAAVSSDVEDEDSFNSQMVDGLWKQVEASMKAPKK
jgi:hypothetical protein